MYKNCRTDQSAKRQRELEKGLLALMCKRRYEDISVSDLCQQMQLPRKSFYRYFSSKDGALYALIDHTLTEFFETPQTEKESRGTAFGDLDQFFAFWYEQKAFLDALHRSNLSGILVERANSFALREGHLPRRFKNLSSEVRDLAMAFSVCGLMSMILYWHRNGFSITADEMARLAMQLLTSPLLHR